MLDAVTKEEIIACCKQRIGSLKAPKSVDFIETLPRSARGKVLKRVLRDKYWEAAHARCEDASEPRLPSSAHYESRAVAHGG